MLPAISEGGVCSSSSSWQRYKSVLELIGAADRGSALSHINNVLDDAMKGLDKIKERLFPVSGQGVSLGCSSPMSALWVGGISDVSDIVDSARGSLTCSMGPGSRFLEEESRVQVLSGTTLSLLVSAMFKAHVVYQALLLEHGRGEGGDSSVLVVNIEKVVMALSCAAHSVQVLARGSTQLERRDVDFFSASARITHIISVSLSQLAGMVNSDIADRILGCVMMISDVSSLLSLSSSDRLEDLRYCHSVAINAAGVLSGMIEDTDVSDRGNVSHAKALKDIVNSAVFVNTYITRNHALQSRVKDEVVVVGSDAAPDRSPDTGLDVVQAAQAISSGVVRVRNKLYSGRRNMGHAATSEDEHSKSNAFTAYAIKKCQERIMNRVPDERGIVIGCEDSGEGSHTQKKGGDKGNEKIPSTVLTSPSGTQHNKKAVSDYTTDVWSM